MGWDGMGWGGCSYLYKTVAPGNPVEDIKLAINTVGSLVRANALRQVAKERALV